MIQVQMELMKFDRGLWVPTGIRLLTYLRQESILAYLLDKVHSQRQGNEG